jgi:hypothetical protein
VVKAGLDVNCNGGGRRFELVILALKTVLGEETTGDGNSGNVRVLPNDVATTTTGIKCRCPLPIGRPDGVFQPNETATTRSYEKLNASFRHDRVFHARSNYLNLAIPKYPSILQSVPNT